MRKIASAKRKSNTSQQAAKNQHASRLSGIEFQVKTHWGQAVKGHIKIKKDLCKECHLCIHFCPKGHIMPSLEFNVQGYHPVCANEEKECNGCAICATMCPDVAIEVYRE